MAMKNLTLVYDDEQGSIPEVTQFIEGVQGRISALEDRLADTDTDVVTGQIEAIEGRVAALESKLAALEARLVSAADVLDGDDE